MSFLPEKGYEIGGSPDIAYEDGLLAASGIRVTSSGADIAPRLDDADPIDLEGLSTRTVRGFNLTSDMTELL
jgi:hypothetical protein